MGISEDNLVSEVKIIFCERPPKSAIVMNEMANEELAHTNTGCLNYSIRKQSMLIWALISPPFP